MQLPFTLPISAYEDSLAHFLAKTAPYESFSLMAGHHNQEGLPQNPDYNPLTMETVRNMYHLCQLLLSKQAVLKKAPAPSFSFRPAMYARYQKAAIILSQGKIK